MVLVERLWLGLGKYYYKKQNIQQAVSYMTKGRQALKTLEDQIVYIELLHNNGYSEEALRYLDSIVESEQEARLYERRAHILRELDREEEAVADLDAALAINDNSYITWYTRGLVHKDLGNYEQAALDMREAIKREDESTVASSYYELGMIYFHNQMPAEAVPCFRESVKRSEQALPLYYFMLARCLDLLDEVQEAVQVLKTGIELLDRYESAPDHGFSLFKESSTYSSNAFYSFKRQSEDHFSFRKLLADLYLQLGEYELGAKAASEGLEKYAGEAELYLKRAEIYAAWGKKALAKEDLELAIHQHPDDFRAYFELARLYRGDANEEKASEIITKLYKRQPDTPLVCYWMADAHYRMGRLQEALKLNDKLLELESDDPANYVQRADIFIESYDLPSAEQAVNTALQLNDSPELHNKLSYILYLQSRNEESLLELQKAVALDPDFEQHLSYLTASGHIYKEMGMWDLAIDAYTKAIHQNPSSPRLYEFRASCFLETGQLDRSLADCSQGLELDSSYAGLYSLRSSTFMAMKDYENAKLDVLKYMELFPGHPGAYFRLGQIHMKDHNEEAALEAFDQVLNIAPEHADSYLYKAYIYFQQLEPEETVQHIVSWSLHLDKEMPPSEKIQAIQSLEGFDESILERAVERLTEMYGHQVYLS